ncbi:DUF3108 domain-containing protein [Halovulum dunhuangense]|uniref:DUF3108 domain-containing protein n=1 Tax=Halovulum dunhuangense TaxID=1505036 RepID=A0A849L135_9RHOB|nr:DUF3108 domain-containing protein [Halovulum dunhuangense]NNU79955.1 DUF3108 domain-containing protein [Halovulum dunhuangense]
MRGMPKGFLRNAVVMLGAVMFAGQAPAQETRQFYDVSVSGLHVGTMDLAANVEGAAYTARGEVRGGGLIGALFSFGFGGVASGRILSDGALQPVIYDGYREDRGDRAETAIRYQGAQVREVTLTPVRKPRPFDIVPQEQRGVLDPISAAFAVLADQPVGAACDRGIEIYDGRRRSRLVIGPRQARGEGFVCSGTYSRVAGYSPGQMAEKVDFPFTIHYREANGQMRVMAIETDSVIGKAVARRR